MLALLPWRRRPKISILQCAGCQGWFGDYDHTVTRCFVCRISTDLPVDHAGAWASQWAKAERPDIAQACADLAALDVPTWRRFLPGYPLVHASRRVLAEKRLNQLMTDFYAYKADPKPCPRCFDSRWICEQHRQKPWPHDDCIGPGRPCHLCNVSDPPVLGD